MHAGDHRGTFLLQCTGPVCLRLFKTIYSHPSQLGCRTPATGIVCPGGYFFNFYMDSFHSSDVYRCESGRCRSLPFILKYFLSFCPLDTALVLTSDSFLFIFPPSPCSLSWWILLESVTWHLLYYEFTHIYSLLTEKDLCTESNVSIKFPCALLIYLCLSSRNLLIFSVRVSPFYSYFYNVLYLHLECSSSFFNVYSCMSSLLLI